MVLEQPPAFAEMLGAAIAQEERDGSGRAEVLRRHYLELMPGMRAAQLDPTLEPQATFMHHRLDLARLPRLRGALERLYALLARCDVPPAAALPAPSPDELVARFPTLATLYAQTYYGAFMPMLHAYPADLAACARELDEASVDEVLDRRLTAPVVHELSHFRRSRVALLPLYLDECIAAHVGVLVLPELAYPAPGEDNGLYATPWLSQVGQALARVVGLAPLVRAHTGVVPWDDVLPPGMRDRARELGWRDYLRHRGPHLLSNNFEPEPWLELVLAGREPPESDEDLDVLADGLRAMCLRNEIVDGTFRASTALPRGPVRIDPVARKMTAPGSACDPVPLAYWIPPALARRWQDAGIAEHTVEIGAIEAIAGLAHVLRG